jgi:hypothetical protein
MKFQTIRIKIVEDIQEYDLSQFIIGGCTVYDKKATVVQEHDGLYWHIVIFYQPTNSFNSSHLPIYPSELKDEVEKILEDHKVNNRVQHAVYNSLKNYKTIKTINDFKSYRNLGQKSITEYNIVLNLIINLYLKYSTKAT